MGQTVIANSNIKHIIVSRTDSIGDVVLTLPVCTVLKKKFPQAKVSFLCRDYTRAVVDLSASVDAIISWDELMKMPAEQSIQSLQNLAADAMVFIFPDKSVVRTAKKAGIPLRIATSRRWHTFFNCNVKVNIKRRSSDLHEAQLNIKLLEPFNINTDYSLNEIKNLYNLKNIQINDYIKCLIKPDKFNLILHPRSKGSAREWGEENYLQLIESLNPEIFDIYICGTSREAETLNCVTKLNLPNVHNFTGKFTLSQYIEFIAACDGLVAASTGPLHIAAALRKHAIGIYAPMRPIHPGRWMPVGEKAKYFVLNKSCNNCRKSENCACIKQISHLEIAAYLQKIL